MRPPAHKPWSQACENNKGPILDALRAVYVAPCTVWEIGSGTGQHAVHFAAGLPHLVWQPTDLAEHLPGIESWQVEACLPNLRPALALDVRDHPWPAARIEAVFTANTLHIMSWAEVEVLFERLGEFLAPGAVVCSYGPFNVGGRYTSESNARFDEWLKLRDPLSGIRDRGALEALGEGIGLRLTEARAMPANNQLLVWRKAD